MTPLHQTIEYNPRPCGPQRAITVTFADRAGDRIMSDAALRTDLTCHEYSDGVLGVGAEIGRFDDLCLELDRHSVVAPGFPGGGRRVLVFILDDAPGVKTASATVHVDGLSEMQVGEMKYTTARFNICSMLVFPHVRATRTSKAIWVVTTDGASDVAVCANGSPQNMPFSLEIRLR